MKQRFCGTYLVFWEKKKLFECFFWRPSFLCEKKMFFQTCFKKHVFFYAKKTCFFRKKKHKCFFRIASLFLRKLKLRQPVHHYRFFPNVHPHTVAQSRTPSFISDVAAVHEYEAWLNGIREFRSCVISASCNI